ncbi:hypothetical protein N311_07220, partial [Apaloderma vittatum]
PPATPLHEVDNENGASGAHSQPQHKVKRHHHPCRLGQLFGHDLGAVDHDQRPQVAIAQPQQRREDHRVDILVKDHCPDVSPGLVVAEDEEWEEDGPEEDEGGQELAPGAGCLDPGGDLPPAPVGKVVQEETCERCKVLGAPQ